MPIKNIAIPASWYADIAVYVTVVSIGETNVLIFVDSCGFHACNFPLAHYVHSFKSLKVNQNLTVNCIIIWVQKFQRERNIVKFLSFRKLVVFIYKNKENFNFSKKKVIKYVRFYNLFQLFPCSTRSVMNTSIRFVLGFSSPINNFFALLFIYDCLKLIHTVLIFYSIFAYAFTCKNYLLLHFIHVFYAKCHMTIFTKLSLSNPN